MENVSVLAFYCVVALIGTLSFDRLIYWIYQKSRLIYRSLDTPKLPTYYSKSALIYCVVLALEVGKGYGMLRLSEFLFYSDSTNLITLLLLITAHAIGAFNGFRVNRYFGLVLWGVYAFVDPVLAVVYPVGYLLLSLLTNSVYFGFLSNIVIMFFVMWSFNIEPIYLPVNFMIFAVALLASRHKLFQHIDGQGFSILDSFKNR